MKFLEFEASENRKLFLLLIMTNDSVTHGQPITYLIENNYKTKTGGIIYYSPSYGRPQKKSTGFIYWVPEEIHQLNLLNLENLRVNRWDHITKRHVPFLKCHFYYKRFSAN